MPTVDFATFQQQDQRERDEGHVPHGWQMDYPSIENFLTPIYASRRELELL